ncbi:hypothetical protein BHU72_04280 [Desulfuribacillus stibiiarsenatis]|uniref:MobA-like NTP transferase domain-containing protein n=1 Tax=Desulfuribacillus stibiiarsenatis TaxID=1390249 RepID=A0A1E5L5R5_9FIRM|nr:nucleotidyltransferase family protein [Desulfuribacillus stibiiarsenatis]OEH85319.1 hypothetical protein BHU72_04280 [Desulfuribacillus stibiiarsenatis]
MKVEGVILAAGLSSRAIVYKMELDFGGKTLIERSIEAIYDLCDQVIVVGGYKIEVIRELTKRFSRVKVVENPAYAKGMFTSVKAGLVATTAEKVLFTPGDYPLITPKTCEIMLHKEGEVVVPLWKGKKGHPIVLRRSLINEILLEPDDSNLKAILRRKIAAFVDVNDPGILIDIDTMSDYNNIIERYKDFFQHK